MGNQQGQCYVVAWIGEVWGRMDTRMCVAESLCCSSETITTLLTGYIPVQRKIYCYFFKEVEEALC